MVMQQEGFRNCVRQMRNSNGDEVTIQFDDIGIPAMEGMALACARTPEEAAMDGEAWFAERRALSILGFQIVELQNAILIFMPE